VSCGSANQIKPEKRVEEEAKSGNEEDDGV
jgi:hypothetical protein